LLLGLAAGPNVWVIAADALLRWSMGRVEKPRRLPSPEFEVAGDLETRNLMLAIVLCNLQAVGPGAAKLSRKSTAGNEKRY
jgi:hypothetical protein